MLKDRILLTLRFFDLQDTPLTLLELHKFLVNENLGGDKEIVPKTGTIVSIGKILKCLEEECQNQVEQKHGHYCLKGRSQLVSQRLENYCYGIKREQLIKKYAPGLRLIPFVKGAALTGSQALGLFKENSDIDLLVITSSRYLWLARTLVSLYFQIFGLRRHGKKTANRFCLNHYVAGPKVLDELKNLYTACEYAKARPVAGLSAVMEFKKNNANWILVFFPNAQAVNSFERPQSFKVQKILEWLLDNRLGLFLEARLKQWQLPKIRQEEFILVRADELSFHPQSKQQDLLKKFFNQFPLPVLDFKE